jgi:Transposase DDE domain
VLRKSEQAARKAQRRIVRKAQQGGPEPKPETLEYANYVIVFTTLETDLFSASDVLEWYRVRWQIEVVFKRLKTLAHLGHLPKRDDRSSRAWLYGKLLVALLSQKLIRLGRDFPLGVLCRRSRVAVTGGASLVFCCTRSNRRLNPKSEDEVLSGMHLLETTEAWKISRRTKQSRGRPVLC